MFEQAFKNIDDVLRKEAGCTTELDERVLVRKEPLLSSYLRHCDQAWLVVVFEIRGGTLHTEGPVRPIEFAVKTGFARVFCLDSLASRCVDIPVGPRV